MNSFAKKVPWVLSLVFFCVCIVLAVMCFAPSVYSPYGAYAAGDGLSAETVYLVLQKDGSYVRYRQFELLEKGRASIAHTDKDVAVLYLCAEDGAPILTAVCGSDKVFLLDGAQGGMVFKKASEDAFYLNIPHASVNPSGDHS